MCSACAYRNPQTWLYLTLTLESCVALHSRTAVVPLMTRRSVGSTEITVRPAKNARRALEKLGQRVSDIFSLKIVSGFCCALTLSTVKKTNKPKNMHSLVCTLAHTQACVPSLSPLHSGFGPAHILTSTNEKFHLLKNKCACREATICLVCRS